MALDTKCAEDTGFGSEDVIDRKVIFHGGVRGMVMVVRNEIASVIKQRDELICLQFDAGTYGEK